MSIESIEAVELHDLASRAQPSELPRNAGSFLGRLCRKMTELGQGKRIRLVALTVAAIAASTLAVGGIALAVGLSAVTGFTAAIIAGVTVAAWASFLTTYFHFT